VYELTVNPLQCSCINTPAIKLHEIDASAPATGLAPAEAARGGGVEIKWRLMMPKSGFKSKFLVVDDEETIGIGISEILKDMGFEAA